MAFEPKEKDEIKAPGAAAETINTKADEAKEPVSEANIFSIELTEKEKASITRKAADKVAAEITAKARSDFEKSELERLRMEAGISKAQLGGANDEMVTIRIDLSDTDGSADPFIQLDMPHGMKYYHGCSYTLPRHKANTINEIMFRGKLSALNKDGKSVFRNRTYGTQLGEHGARHTGIRETRVN